MVCLYSNVKRHLLCYLLPIKTQPQTVCRGADVGNQQVPSPSPYLAFVQNMHFGWKRGLNLHVVSAQFTLFVPGMVSHPKLSGRWYHPPCPRPPGCAVLLWWPAPPSCPAFIVPVLVPQIDPSVPQPAVQSRRRPLLGPSPGWKRLLPLSHLRHY